MIMIMSAVLSAAWLAHMVSASPEVPPKPRVVLEAPIATVQLQRPVAVRLIVDNDSGESRFVYLTFAPPSVAQGPETVLTFSVVGPDGASIAPRQPTVPAGLRAVGFRCGFLEMSSGQFIGNRFDLNGPLFSYDFTKPGLYRVRARLTFMARAWLEKYAETEGKSLSKEFRSLLAARSLFYDGSAESNEIIIEVR